MENALLPLLVAVGLIVGMIVVLDVGRRLGARRRAKAGGELGGLGGVEGAVFGLLGLLIAFTFSEAASRFNVRREQIVEESNVIGTAWLRLDLLPADAQPALRDAFRRYVDARLEVFRKFASPSRGRAEMIDFAATRTQKALMHPPPVIYVTLCILAFAAALIAGYGMGAAGTRSWFHTIAFAIILGLAVDVILDLEFPRVGFIRIDRYDQILVDLRQSMK